MLSLASLLRVKRKHYSTVQTLSTTLSKEYVPLVESVVCVMCNYLPSVQSQYVTSWLPSNVELLLLHIHPTSYQVANLFRALPLEA